MKKEISVIIFPFIIYGITWHFIYILTDNFWTQENYCQNNVSSFREFDRCTRSVTIAGFLQVILPVMFGIMTFTIAKRRLLNAQV